jgi:hypothetical protein
MTEVLRNIRHDHPTIPLFVDVSSSDDVARSVEFFRTATRPQPVKKG